MSGVRTVFYPESDGGVTIRRIQYCEPILDSVKTINSQGRQKGDMRLAARVPEIVVEDYCNRNGITFAEFIGNDEHVRRLVNDPAYSYFRTGGTI